MKRKELDDLELSYFQENKAAWEEAFDHRHPGWGESHTMSGICASGPVQDIFFINFFISRVIQTNAVSTEGIT